MSTVCSIYEKFSKALDRVSLDMLIDFLARRVERVIQRNKSSLPANNCFYSIVDCSVTPKEYMKRFSILFNNGEENVYKITLIAAVILLKQYSNDSQTDCVKKRNFHRLFASAFLISYKFWHDCTTDNTTFAKIAGVSLKELNKLEVKFLKSIQFNVNIVTDRFIKKYLRSLFSRLEEIQKIGG